MSADPDFTRYVDARWADLVGGLEDEGVAPDDARLAVASTLLASRRSWARRVRDEQVDVSIWAEARERAGLDPRPGETAPHGVRPRDPRDGPEEWFEHAGHARAARRRRGARRFAVGLVVGALLVTGWAWWDARPDPPDVREEANPLPVIWHASGELHLAEVVVELPDVEEFAADGSGAVARLRSGAIVRVDADGGVEDADGGALGPRPGGGRAALLPAGPLRRAGAERSGPRWRVGAPDRLLPPRRSPGRAAPVGVRPAGARRVHGRPRVRRARHDHPGRRVDPAALSCR